MESLQYIVMYTLLTADSSSALFNVIKLVCLPSYFSMFSYTSQLLFPAKVEPFHGSDNSLQSVEKWQSRPSPTPVCDVKTVFLH